jgi:spermidine synthase
VLPGLLDELGDARRCGQAYAWNTLGAVAGSLLAAWCLLPWLGFARSAWLLGAVPLVLAALAGGWGARVAAAAAAVLGLGVAVTSTSSLGRERVQGAGFDLLSEHEVLAYREGPDSTVSVVAGADGSRFLMIDGFTASAEGRAGTDYMEWMGRLPMLAHARPERALVICFGTGRTAGAVRDEGPRALDIVELSPAVFDMAHHFTSNHDVLSDERVRPIAMDGRAWLRRTTERYDVVTLEPMPPGFAGVNALYSSEFYEIVARRLAPGGVVAQWVPFHLLPPLHAASVVTTFQGVFPDALLWVTLAGCVSVEISPETISSVEGRPEEVEHALTTLRQAVTTANEFLASEYNTTLPKGEIILSESGMTFEADGISE